jgi:hypothetical protein
MRKLHGEGSAGCASAGKRAIAYLLPKRELIMKKAAKPNWFCSFLLVENRGLEPLTSTLPALRSPS